MIRQRVATHPPAAALGSISNSHSMCIIWLHVVITHLGPVPSPMSHGTKLSDTDLRAAVVLLCAAQLLRLLPAYAPWRSE